MSEFQVTSYRFSGSRLPVQVANIGSELPRRCTTWSVQLYLGGKVFLYTLLSCDLVASLPFDFEL
jgi:hypothetical protein